jgi:pseudouridine synthase
MRINAYLAKAGFGSRRKVEALVENRRVSINGTVLEKLAYQVASNDTVSVDGKVVRIEKSVYYALNKPTGVISSTAKQTADPIVLDFVPAQSHVFIVGRLDKDSQGLIIITNDGDFAQKINHPTAKIAKTYQVAVSGSITAQKINQMKRGVMVGGQSLAADNVVKIAQDQLLVTLHEGKHRHIRRLCAALDMHVTKLSRERIGNLKVDGIQPGSYRRITPADVL